MGYRNALHVKELPEVRAQLAEHKDTETRLTACGQLMHDANAAELAEKNRLYMALLWLNCLDDRVWTQTWLVNNVPGASKLTWDRWINSHTGTLPDYASADEALAAAREAGVAMQRHRNTAHTALNVARETVTEVAETGWTLSQTRMAKLLRLSQPRIAQMPKEMRRMRAGLGPQQGRETAA